MEKYIEVSHLEQFEIYRLRKYENGDLLLLVYGTFEEEHLKFKVKLTNDVINLILFMKNNNDVASIINDLLFEIHNIKICTA